MRPAYTLIELLLIIIILALLAAFAVPTFQLIISQEQLSTTTAQLGDTFRKVAQDTVTQQKDYGLKLCTDNNASFMEYILGDPNISSSVPCPLTPPRFFSLPNNIIVYQMPSNTNYIYFNSAGAPNVNGNIILKDTARNRCRNLVIQPSGSISTNQPETNCP
jgi:type II secretory pathway pseudopilin PulG